MCPVLEYPDATAAIREALPPDEHQQGVIEEARRRQRRRHGGILVVVVLGALAATLATYRSSGGHAHATRVAASHPPSVTRGAIQRPTSLFVEPPGLGVACPVADSIACDRVGLEVWLRRPAVAISATIAGRRVRFDPQASSPLRHGRRTFFDGYLDRAGIETYFHVKPDADLHWNGSHAPSTAVRLRIDYGNGATVSTQIKAQLTPGFG
jgi:hypothetical protein